METRLTCSVCGQVKIQTDFYRDKKCKRGYTYRCKACTNAYTKKHRNDPKIKASIEKTKRAYYLKYGEAIRLRIRERKRKDPRLAMYRSCKGRASWCDLEFSIDISDIIIPDICPVLGIPLFVGTGSYSDNSPSVDRTVPKLGYVKGNIDVISNRANRIKNDATLEEIEALAAYMRSKCRN